MENCLDPILLGPDVFLSIIDLLLEKKHRGYFDDILSLRTVTQSWNQYLFRWMKNRAKIVWKNSSPGNVEFFSKIRPTCVRIFSLNMSDNFIQTFCDLSLQITELDLPKFDFSHKATLLSVISRCTDLKSLKIESEPPSYKIPVNQGTTLSKKLNDWVLEEYVKENKSICGSVFDEAKQPDLCKTTPWGLLWFFESKTNRFEKLERLICPELEAYGQLDLPKLVELSVKSVNSNSLGKSITTVGHFKFLETLYLDDFNNGLILNGLSKVETLRKLTLKSQEFYWQQFSMMKAIPAKKLVLMSTKSICMYEIIMNDVRWGHIFPNLEHLSLYSDTYIGLERFFPESLKSIRLSSPSDGIGWKHFLLTTTTLETIKIKVEKIVHLNTETLMGLPNLKHIDIGTKDQESHKRIKI